MKYIRNARRPSGAQSPSARREWIEMDAQSRSRHQRESPSARREWIEIASGSSDAPACWSPSARREWIEIVRQKNLPRPVFVSLREEGVD